MLHSNCWHQVKDNNHSTKLCQILYIAKQDQDSLSPSVVSCMKTLSQEKCECPSFIGMALEIIHCVACDFNMLDYHISFTCLPLVIVLA